MKVDVTKIEGYAGCRRNKGQGFGGFEIAEPDYTGMSKKKFLIKPVAKLLLSYKSSSN